MSNFSNLFTHIMRRSRSLVFLSALVWANCNNGSQNDIPEQQPFFARGADVSWLTEMEAEGLKFYNREGNEQECMLLLKNLGINSIRLRAWVNPQAGWNNTADLVVKAKRAHALGLKIMINFHYSDDWADPGKQFKPKAWQDFSIAQLTTALASYTRNVMDTLKTNGITPEWVQIGNETNDGMLWEEGRASASMENFAALIKAGYNAVKAVSPTSQVIVHLSNGYDNGLFRWMFDGLKQHGATWDIIGLSVYPYWSPAGVNGWVQINQQALTNMNDLVSRYSTPVMVVEVGMPANDPVTSKAFLSDIIRKTKAVNNNQGLGVFYWEPQCYNNWKGYTLGAFDDSGKPTIAMDAFAAD